jgi:hypothetical protein
MRAACAREPLAERRQRGVLRFPERERESERERERERDGAYHESGVCARRREPREPLAERRQRRVLRLPPAAAVQQVHHQPLQHAQEPARRLAGLRTACTSTAGAVSVKARSNVSK